MTLLIVVILVAKSVIVAIWYETWEFFKMEGVDVFGKF